MTSPHSPFPCGEGGQGVRFFLIPPSRVGKGVRGLGQRASFTRLMKAKSSIVGASGMLA